MMSNRLAILFALALAGCGKSTPSDETISEPANEEAAANAVTPQIAIKPATPVPPTPLSGKFEAVSTTAMGVTGDLTAAPGSFTFDMDQSYSVGPPSEVDAATAYDRSGDNWADLLIVPKDAKVTIWWVVTQEIGKGAGSNGGLCGSGGIVHYIATATKDDQLQLAAFKGNAAPGPDAPETQLCGTYNYAKAR